MSNIFKTLSQGCDKNCRFHQLGASTMTAMYFAPVYDKDGNNLNPDGNIRTTSYHCVECGKSWRVSDQKGQSTITLLTEEISKPNIVDGSRLNNFANNTIQISSGTGKIDYSTDFEYLEDHY